MRVTGTISTGFGAAGYSAQWRRPAQKRPVEETAHKNEDATPPPRERRRFGLTGAAAQSVFAARLTAPASDQFNKIRAAEVAMGGQRRMTNEAIEAELRARQTSRAWVFERRKGQMPRAGSAEDAIILDDASGAGRAH